MPKVKIDGKTIEVPNGTLVVEAAKAVGVQIPVFCHHPKLEPVGMCRMCLVEVGTPKRGKDGQVEKDTSGNTVIAWMPKLQTACTTAVSEGMAVRTDTAQVAEARRSIVEFLLTSHPLDCPICDKGGECPLQNLTLAYGPGQSRFAVEEKYSNERQVPLGDLILLNRERCVQCSRCIRFMREIADDQVLGFQMRGRNLEVTSLSNPPFDSKFSGNVIDLCPVGGMTSRDFRLSARVWEIKDQSSICPHCSVGCNILVGERDHQIKRIVSRENEAVNGIWLCNKGRFVHHYADSPERLTTPLIRKNGSLELATWDEALDVVAKRVLTIKNESGASAIGGLVGDRASNEDLYLFQRLFREVIGSNNLDHRVGWSATNVGAELIHRFGAGRGTNLGTLDKNVTVLALGADPEEEQPVLRLRLTESVRRSGANLIVANGRLTKLAKYAKQSIIYRYGAEGMFLLGIVRAILDENLHNQEFVQAHVKDYYSFKQSLSPYTVEVCAEGSGVSPDALRQAARSFAASRDALILFGREAMAAQQQDRAVASGIAALLLLTRHIGKANNGLIGLYPHNNSTGAIDFGLTPVHGLGRLRTEKNGLGASAMLSGQVRALYVMACNPAEYASFVKPELLVVQDLFLTETARQADVVFPAQSFAERDGTFTNTERRVQLFRAAIKSVGKTKPDWSIVSECAKRLGAAWKYANAAEIMDEISATVPLYAGMTHSALAENVYKPRYQFRHGNPSHSPTEIATGELENVSSGKQWLTVAESDPNAQFALVWQDPRRAKDDQGAFLATCRSLFDRGTLVHHSSIVQSLIPTPYVELNSHDAEEYEIKTGMLIRLSWSSCTIDLNARVDGRVPPGVVLVPNNLDGTGALPVGMRVKVEKL